MEAAAAARTIIQLRQDIKDWCTNRRNDPPIEFICDVILPAIEAIAPLVVVTPALLASLKELREASYGNPSYPDVTAAVDARADAAIKKAEGK